MPKTDTLLDELSNLRGIEPRFVDMEGRAHEISRATKKRLLEAMGFDLGSETSLREAIDGERARPWRRLVESVAVSRVGEAARLRFHLPGEAGPSLGFALGRLFVRLRGERGDLHPVDLRLGAAVAAATVDGIPRIRFEVPVSGLAPGAYAVEAFQCGTAATIEEGRLYVAPPHCYLPASLERGARILGFAAQTYSLPDFDGGGVGTIAAAGDLAAALAKSGASLLGLSPLHPTPNRAPGDHSPYCPLSREWRNPVLLDLAREPLVWETPSVRRLLANRKLRGEWKRLEGSPRVRYEKSMGAKDRLLRAAWGDFLERERAGDAETASFQHFCESGGRSLADFATFEALRAMFGRRSRARESWQRWPAEFRDPRSAAVAEFQAHERDEVRYHAFLQWLLERQLSEAQRSARTAGMEVGLYQDLAVGSSGSSADAWAEPELFPSGAEVGAPPDLFQRKGQTWGVVPMDPVRLRESGYEAFLRMLRASMEHAGALRLDHVMGLFRLWWVPRGRPATEGAYVKYPADELLALVALESWRRRCLVVGEDLGTVPQGVRERMERERILGCRLLVFERTPEGGFADPRRYPQLSVASFATHDLPTFAGWWRGKDVSIRRRLGLFRNAKESQRAPARRAVERRELVKGLERAGLRAADSAPQPPVEALHRWLGKAGSAVALSSLEDAFGVEEQRNLPGTTREYPNWMGRLRLSMADLTKDDRLRAAAAALFSERCPEATGARNAS